ncbi:MAG TPA: lipopolysaccharide kinase InaA family protein [Candidatus Wunengus sp. YC63]|uniref:lipopolysaccharide kinase InaA family protein n=1 Tax=unclassified Candidatus Wunengus TaxID=3367695 RepID=UPI00402773DB
MFKGYISNIIGRVLWTIHTQSSFLIPYLERISDGISGKSKEPADDILLTIIRKDRYKILGEFKVFHANEEQTYLVKMYKYPGLIQKVKQLFKKTRGFREFNTTYVAAMKGVPVEVPVAYGERKHLFARESYLVIKKIKHACTLREYFRSSVSPEERRDVLKKFGKLAKTVHDSGVKQDDFSLDNFLAYANETGERRVILIDFERVSLQANSLSSKQRVWYLAKLNRSKRYFTNTDRLRFLLSYTGGDVDYCKKLARQIETVTVHIQKKDAKKFYKQCVLENRKFGIFKNENYYGHIRKDYSPETLLSLLSTVEESTQEVRYINNFRIAHFTGRDRVEQNFKQVWMHANALFALRIGVPVPVGIFNRHSAKLSREGFLVSQIPENGIPLNQYADLHSGKNAILYTLLRLAEQVSPFGTFSKDLSTHDFLVQMKGNQLECYLGNYTAFHINHHPVQKNRTVNTRIIKQLLQTDDT